MCTPRNQGYGCVLKLIHQLFWTLLSWSSVYPRGMLLLKFKFPPRYSESILHNWYKRSHVRRRTSVWIFIPPSTQSMKCLNSLRVFGKETVSSSFISWYDTDACCDKGIYFVATSIHYREDNVLINREVNLLLRVWDSIKLQGTIPICFPMMVNKQKAAWRNLTLDIQYMLFWLSIDNQYAVLVIYTKT